MTINELYLANTSWSAGAHIKVVSDRVDWRTLFEGNFIEMPEEIKKLNVRTFSDSVIVTR